MRIRFEKVRGKVSSGVLVCRRTRQYVGQSSRLTGRELSNEIDTREARGWIHACKKSAKDRQRHCSRRIWCKSSPAIDIEIPSGILEFLQKTVFENVDFV